MNRVGVLVVGDVINDVIILPAGPTSVDSDTMAEITAAPGGSGANQAAWLAWLGDFEVRLVGRAGEADVDVHRSQLTRAGVDARLEMDPDLPTGSIAVLVGDGGIRSMYTDRGANARLTDLSSPDLLHGMTHLHVSGYALIEATSRAAVASLWRAAADSGVARSVDVGSAAFLSRDRAGFLEWTSGADLIFANLAEGCLVTGVTGARDRVKDEVVTRLLERYTHVVLKLGSEGAIVATRSERVFCAPPNDVVVDPTGAGDAFCAAFLASWLTGSALAEAGRAATVAAGHAMSRVGGRPPIPASTPTPAPGASALLWGPLRDAARSASARAYAPYSNLFVGAAGISDDGRIVTGCNVENASIGLTLCAECGLVSALRATGSNRLVAVSVVAQDGQPLAPCGRCRQLLLENGGPQLSIDRGPGRDPALLGDLLPGAFDAHDLSERRAP